MNIQNDSMESPMTADTGRSSSIPKLTAKQLLFCAAYIESHGNISESARQAKCSRMSAHRWLRCPDILAEIARSKSRKDSPKLKSVTAHPFSNPEDRLIAECELLLDGDALKPSEKFKVIETLAELYDRKAKRAATETTGGADLDEFMRSVLSGGADLFA